MYISLFLILVLLNGCYSFVRIDKNEFDEIKGENEINIYLTSGEKVELKNVQSTKITGDKIEFVDKYTRRSIIILKQIDQMEIEKIDYPRTILTPLFIGLGIAFLFFIFGGSLSPGG